MSGSETELLNAIKEFQQERTDNLVCEISKLTGVVHETKETIHQTQLSMLNHFKSLPCKTHSTKLWFHFWLLGAAFTVLGFILLR